MLTKKNSLVSQLEAIADTKIPPMDTNIEEGVIGVLMQDFGNVWKKVGSWLSPEVFYLESNSLIFNAIQRLANENKGVDLFTVSHFLKESGELETVGGIHYLSGIGDRVATSAHVETHCLILVQLYFRRKLIEESIKLGQSSYETTTDSLEALLHTQKTLTKLLELVSVHSYSDLSEEITEAKERIKKALEGNHVPGIQTGFRLIDTLTYGRLPGMLTIRAGRPSHGKSTMTYNELWNMVESGISVLLVSLETAPVEVLNKIISIKTGIDNEKILLGNLKEYEVKEVDLAFSYIESKKPLLHIPKIFNLTISDLQTLIRRYVREFGVKVVFVDYLQLVQGLKSATRDIEIGTISRGLKSVCTETGVHIVCLAQLSREVEKRADKRPIISDLRESGNIEQDADIIEFIFCPDKYNLQIDGIPDNRGIVDLCVAKNRNGKIGGGYLRFARPICLFTDFEVETTVPF